MVQYYLMNRGLPFDEQHVLSPETQSHRLYLASNLVAHDSILMRGGIDRAITEMDALKHMLIYGDRLVLP